jgi:hypothetical protein
MYEDPASEDYDLWLDSPCVLILTPYSSPDLTPMEQMFVKNMGVLRQAAARIRKLLVETLRVRPSRLSPLKTPAVYSKPAGMIRRCSRYDECRRSRSRLVNR